MKKSCLSLFMLSLLSTAFMLHADGTMTTSRESKNPELLIRPAHLGDAVTDTSKITRDATNPTALMALTASDGTPTNLNKSPFLMLQVVDPNKISKDQQAKEKAKKAEDEARKLKEEKLKRFQCMLAQYEQLLRTYNSQVLSKDTKRQPKQTLLELIEKQQIGQMQQATHAAQKAAEENYKTQLQAAAAEHQQALQDPQANMMQINYSAQLRRLALENSYKLTHAGLEQQNNALINVLTNLDPSTKEDLAQLFAQGLNLIGLQNTMLRLTPDAQQKLLQLVRPEIRKEYNLTQSILFKIAHSATVKRLKSSFASPYPSSAKIQDAIFNETSLTADTPTDTWVKGAALGAGLASLGGVAKISSWWQKKKNSEQSTTTTQAIDVKSTNQLSAADQPYPWAEDMFNLYDMLKLYEKKPTTHHQADRYSVGNFISSVRALSQKTAHQASRIRIR